MTASREIDQAESDPPPGRQGGQCECGRGDEQVSDAEVMGVHGGDHDQPDDVIDDGHGQDEAPQSVRHPASEQGEHPQGERRVGRHRNPPPVDRGPPGVDRQVDANGAHHPSQARHHRQDDAGALAEFADIELAAGFETHHQEEEGHQTAVDPLAQRQGQVPLTDPHRHNCVPHPLVGPVVDVRPHQPGHRRAHQNRPAAGLGAQKTTQRGVPATPRRTATAGGCDRRVGRPRPITPHPGGRFGPGTVSHGLAALPSVDELSPTRLPGTPPPTLSQCSLHAPFRRLPTAGVAVLPGRGPGSGC